MRDTPQQIHHVQQLDKFSSVMSHLQLHGTVFVLQTFDMAAGKT